MRWTGAVLGAVVCACALQAQVGTEEYRARRQAARKAPADAILVLFGRTAEEMEDRSGTVQEPDFYYLTGWMEPGAILLVAPNREALFLPPHDPAMERYTGPRAAAGDDNIRKVTGFEDVLPVAQFEAEFTKALASGGRVLALGRDARSAKLRALAPLREFGEADSVVGTLRAKKSAAELALIQKSTDVSVEAHRAAWRRIAPEVFEYQVAATMTYTMLDRGCQGNAYDPIVGSGPNATVLHYSANSRRMRPGELVLMDVGAQCGAYATDITRTVPVSGRFTPRQRELYGIVLGAQKAAIAAVKPGARIPDLTTVARQYLDAHGKDRSGQPLGKYLTHRVSHGVGLEVHDYPGPSYSDPLEPGMVITVEPGVYIPEENIGIRIEDTLVVTETGARVLSAALPTEADDIERTMAK